LFGHYARVLVDVDLSEKLFDYVLVEREGHVFPIPIEYEKHPDFCQHCKALVHVIHQCKKLQSSKDTIKKSLNMEDPDEVKLFDKLQEAMFE